MRSNTALLEDLIDRCTIVWWKRWTGRNHAVYCSTSFSIASLRLHMLRHEERLALAECLARVDWYRHCGHMLNAIEIPARQRSFVRRLMRRQVLELLVPLDWISNRLQQLKPEIELNEGRVPWWDLADEAQVEEQVVRDAIALYGRKGQLPEHWQGGWISGQTRDEMRE